MSSKISKYLEVLNTPISKNIKKRFLTEESIESSINFVVDADDLEDNDDIKYDQDAHKHLNPRTFNSLDRDGKQLYIKFVKEANYLPSSKLLSIAKGLFNFTATTKRNLTSLLIEGIAGSGKTSFAEALAKVWGAKFNYIQLHKGTSPEDLIYSVNVASVISKDYKNAFLLGPLVTTALVSETEKVVLCIDELDKANPAIDNVFLDFLQNGSVVLPPVILKVDDGKVDALDSSVLKDAVGGNVKSGKHYSGTVPPVEVEVTSKEAEKLKSNPMIKPKTNMFLEGSNTNYLSVNKKNVIVVFTSNGERSHSDAFYRRSKRLFFSPLSVKQVSYILKLQLSPIKAYKELEVSASDEIITDLSKLYGLGSQLEAELKGQTSALSPQEIYDAFVNALGELTPNSSYEHFLQIFEGYILRNHAQIAEEISGSASEDESYDSLLNDLANPKKIKDGSTFSNPPMPEIIKSMHEVLTRLYGNTKNLLNTPVTIGVRNKKGEITPKTVPFYKITNKYGEIKKKNND
jgi:SpoVK/Ycf46/Vps4 family AAA+-type ATPase